MLRNEKNWIEEPCYIEYAELNGEGKIINGNELEKNMEENEQYVIALTEHNVKMVNFMIKNNSRYNVGILDEKIRKLKHSNKEEETKEGNEKVAGHQENRDETNEYKTLLEEVIREIDKINSTHILSDVKKENIGKNNIQDGATRIMERIIKVAPDIDSLMGCLMDEDYNLIQIISEFSDCSNKKNNDGDDNHREGEDEDSAENVIRPRQNISFATKFCYHLSMGLLDGEYKDKYSKFDGVVSSKLDEYIKAYEIDVKKLFKDEEFPYWDEPIKDSSLYYDLKKLQDIAKKDKNKTGKKRIKNTKECYKKVYKNYQKIIGAIIDSAEEKHKEKSGKISRDGFDHILWYLNK